MLGRDLCHDANENVWYHCLPKDKHRAFPRQCFWEEHEHVWRNGGYESEKRLVFKQNPLKLLFTSTIGNLLIHLLARISPDFKIVRPLYKRVGECSGIPEAFNRIIVGAAIAISEDGPLMKEYKIPNFSLVFQEFALKTGDQKGDNAFMNRPSMSGIGSKHIDPRTFQYSSLIGITFHGR